MSASFLRWRGCGEVPGRSGASSVARVLPQDKQELLRLFVSSDENLEALEFNLRVSREQQGSIEHTRELLTIPQMQERGFSECFGCIPASFHVSLHDAKVQDLGDHPKGRWGR